MTKHLLVALLCLLSFQAFSQSKPKTELSAPFSAMNCYKSRVIQCSNGNTFLFNYRKSGCDFLLFDAQRKMIKRAPLTGRLAGAGESNDSYVSNIFETDTTLSIFLSQKIGGRSTMFRIVISPATGNVINEQKIAELNKPKSGSGWAMTFGSVYADISVVNNQESGSYAVVCYDGFTETDSARMHVDLYNAKHQQLWSCIYNKLAPEHKYFEYSALTIKDDKVFLCTHEWTTRSYGTEESILVLSEMAQGKVTQQQKLNLEPDLKVVNVYMLYAPTTKRVMLCMCNRDGEFKEKFVRYKTSISAINENDFSMAYSKELTLDALDAYSRKACSKRKDFGGSFNTWMLDENDNPRLLLSEFLTMRSVTPSAYSNHVFSSSTNELGDVGIVQLDKDGNQTTNYVVAHAEVGGSNARPRIMNNAKVLGAGFGEQPKFLYENLASAEFDGCNYIHTANCDYLIYNVDRKEILESICDGIAGARGNRSPAALYTIKNGTQTRDYLFEPPVDGDLFRSAVMSSSDYSRKTNTYAVVMTEQHEKKMISHLAWIQF